MIVCQYIFIDIRESPPQLEFWQWALFGTGFLAVLYALSVLPISYWLPRKEAQSVIWDLCDSIVDSIFKSDFDPDNGLDPLVTRIEILVFLLGVLLLVVAVRSLF